MKYKTEIYKYLTESNSHILAEEIFKFMTAHRKVDSLIKKLIGVDVSYKYGVYSFNDKYLMKDKIHHNTVLVIYESSDIVTVFRGEWKDETVKEFVDLLNNRSMRIKLLQL